MPKLTSDYLADNYDEMQTRTAEYVSRNFDRLARTYPGECVHIGMPDGLGGDVQILATHPIPDFLQRRLAEGDVPAVNQYAFNFNTYHVVTDNVRMTATQPSGVRVVEGNVKGPIGQRPDMDQMVKYLFDIEVEGHFARQMAADEEFTIMFDNCIPLETGDSTRIGILSYNEDSERNNFGLFLYVDKYPDHQSVVDKLQAAERIY